MSRRREIARRLDALSDIGGILSAMKDAIERISVDIGQFFNGSSMTPRDRQFTIAGLRK
jgi:hypothetical protein